MYTASISRKTRRSSVGKLIVWKKKNVRSSVEDDRWVYKRAGIHGTHIGVASIWEGVLHRLSDSHPGRVTRHPTYVSRARRGIRTAATATSTKMKKTGWWVEKEREKKKTMRLECPVFCKTITCSIKLIFHLRIIELHSRNSRKYALHWVQRRLSNLSKFIHKLQSY